MELQQCRPLIIIDNRHLSLASYIFVEFNRKPKFLLDTFFFFWVEFFVKFDLNSNDTNQIFY